MVVENIIAIRRLLFMIQTHKIFNKTATNNVVFQDVHSNIQTSLLSSCPFWIILMVSGLLFAQTSHVNAMENPDINKIQAHTKAPKTDLSNNTTQPLTQEFWEKRDLSDRLKSLMPEVNKIKNEITNHKENLIEITENLEGYKDILRLDCDPELDLPLQEVPYNELTVSSDKLKMIGKGRSGNKVFAISRGDKNLIFIKKFNHADEDRKEKKVNKIEEGLKELFSSLIAFDDNPSPEKLKMARIYDAFLYPENTLNIIMVPAKGKDIGHFLSPGSSEVDSPKDFSPEKVIIACAKYLARFHIKNYDVNKNIHSTDKVKFTSHASEPYHRTISDLLANEEEEDSKFLNLSVGMRGLEQDEKVASNNIIRTLKKPEEQEIFKELVEKSREKFKKNCYQIFEKDTTYFLTRTHGDAQKDNFFYDVKATGIPFNSPSRITMIDYASIIETYGNIGDPAEDVGRFVGSLWDLAEGLEDTEFANKKISYLQKLFIQAYLDKIKKSKIFSSEEDKQTFEGIFKENCSLYEVRFYRAVFNNNNKDNEIKRQILESWIKKNSALESLLPEVQKKPIERPERKDFIWEAVSTDQGKIIHSIPVQSEVFIESAADEPKESYLTRVWKDLKETNLAIITGMGGIGKTSLAVEYANEALKNNAYDLIYWIKSGTKDCILKDTKDYILKGYIEFLKNMGVSDSDINGKDENSIIDRVNTYFSSKEKCLLIFDNVHCAKDFWDFLGKKIPPKSHMLITCRDNDEWEKRFPGTAPINLDAFSIEHSISYLLQITRLREITGSQKVPEIVGKLAKKLKGFPLVLSYAAHYLRLIGGNNISDAHFEEYLQILDEEIKNDSVTKLNDNRDSFKDRESEITYNNLIVSTFRISKRYLGEDIATLAEKILACCSYLDPDSISSEIFIKYWPDKNEKNKIEQILKTLTALSLIKEVQQNSSFSIHEILHLVLKSQKLSNCKQTLLDTVKMFNDMFKDKILEKIEIEKLLDSLAHISELLKYSQPEYSKHSDGTFLQIEEIDSLQWIGRVLFLSAVGNSEIFLLSQENVECKRLKILKNIQALFGSDDLPESLEQVFKNGSPEIQLLLSKIFSSGYLGVRQETSKGVYWCEEAAKQEDPIANYNLGDMYLVGGGEKNYQKTHECWDKAAKKEHPMGQYGMGLIYFENKNYQEARVCWDKAAKKENTDALYALGKMYETGIGVDKDPVKASELYFKAKGHAGAERAFYMLRLGVKSLQNPTLCRKSVY